jgi:large conductance mechanosensitive channel
MLQEFRQFIARGNVIDLAVGVIIGAAFGKIVTSLVDDVIMPPIGFLLGRVNFADLFLQLAGEPQTSLAEARKLGAPVIGYGAFLNTVVQFLIVAFCVFLLVKAVNRFQRGPADEEAPTMKECPYCCSSVPPAATRCAHCTSQLEAAA